jgi:PAS domain S-box-containing protein
LLKITFFAKDEKYFDQGAFDSLFRFIECDIDCRGIAVFYFPGPGRDYRSNLRQLALLRDLRREQIITFYESRGSELAVLAASGAFPTQNSLIQNSRKFASEAEAGSSDPLFRLVTDTAHCRALFFIKADGSVSNLQCNTMQQKAFSLYLDSTSKAILNPFSYSAGSFIIFESVLNGEGKTRILACPVYGIGKEVLGFLALALRPEAVNSIVYHPSPGIGFGESGEAYLVGADGMMRSPSRFLAGAEMVVPARTRGFERAMAGEEGQGIYPDYRGVSVLGAYGTVTAGGFREVILAEIDVAEAMIPLTAIRNEILVVSLVILLVIFFFTWFLAYGITRPLVRLKRAANMVTEGNYNQQLEIEKDDEIGELTRAFNIMTSEIRSATQELLEKESRLRHFYEATLDGIVLHNKDIPFLFNSAILRMSGFTHEEFSQIRVSGILRDIAIDRCRQGQDPSLFESVLTCKSGDRFPVEVQESCIDFNGRSIRASVIRDISTRKNMESELADERNKRIRAVFDGKDAEQQRLSRELHDGLGQQLIAGKLILESSLYEQENILKSRILEVQRIFDQIIHEIRRISHDLSPGILKEFGLKTAVESLCRSLDKTAGIRVNCRCGDMQMVGDELISTYLYRIIQESLNNVQIHSGATEVFLKMEIDGHDLVLEIEDNGRGFVPESAGKSGGNGLYNIRERVGIMKGRLNVRSSPGKGARITVRVPLNSNGSNFE